MTTPVITLGMVGVGTPVMLGFGPSLSGSSAVGVASLLILNSSTIRVVFSGPISADASTYDPGRYIIEPRLGGPQVYVKKVTPLGPSGTFTHVDLSLREHLLRRGSYSIRLDRLLDVAGVESDTSQFLFSDSLPFWPVGQTVDWDLIRPYITGTFSGVSLVSPGVYRLTDTTQKFEVSRMQGYMVVDANNHVFSVIDNDLHTITLSALGPAPVVGGYSVIETPIGAPGMFWQLKSYVFKWMNTQADALLGATLHVISKFNFRFGGNEGATGGVQAVRDGIVLRTATGVDLNIIGQNYGIARAIDPNLNDVQFRAYVQAMAFKSKAIRSRIEEILTIAVGPKGAIGWEVYEPRPNTIVIELGNVVFPVDPSFSTTLDGDHLPSPVFSTGDYLVDVDADTPGSVDEIDGVAVPAPIPHNGVFLSNASALPFLNELLDLVKAAGVHVEIYMNQDG